MQQQHHQEAPAARSLKAFAKSVGLGLSTLYTLKPEHRPHAVKLGKRVLVTEEPSAWLERVGRLATGEAK